MTPRTTRCQPGDLAEFVRGSPNAGRRVIVDRPASSFDCGDHDYDWVCLPLQMVEAALGFDGRQYVMTGAPILTLDRLLRPIGDLGAENQDAEPVDVLAHG